MKKAPHKMHRIRLISTSLMTLLLITLINIQCCIPKISYEQDLTFMYLTLKENHPGAYNEKDPEFNAILEQGYQEAQSAMGATSDQTERKAVIERFSRGFGDSHLYVSWQDTAYGKQSENVTEDVTDRLFSLTQIDQDTVFISLPTFYMQAHQKESLVSVINTIPSVRAKKHIIIDIRGNRGGNSDNGSAIVNALFSKEYAEHQRAKAYANEYVDWRATAQNCAHLEQLNKKLNLDWLQEVIQGMQEAIQYNNPYYRRYSSNKPLLDTQVPNPLSAHITVLIDGHNVSAALDFIDELKMMEHPVTLVGETTKADRLYMELRTVPLPSGEGTLSFPIKVYRNRIRGDNEPYHPDITWNGIDSIQRAHHTDDQLKVILLHGNGSSAIDDLWFPYVKAELEACGITVVAKQFPDTYLARADYWLPFLQDECKADEHSILVGHSSGAIAAMRFAEEHVILGSVLIGAYHTDLGIEREKLSGYFDVPWQWDTIQKNQHWIVQFASTNDPWIPIEEARFVHNKLASEYYEYDDRGHFNSEQTFPELLQVLLSCSDCDRRTR